MSKELEALNKYIDLCIKLKTGEVKYDEVIDEMRTLYEPIKKALTPPTAEEVCEAIQRELEYGTVEYVEGNREFMFVNHGEKANITEVYGDRYKVTGFYKSSTLTLIGRFYHSLEGVEHERD